MNPSRITLAAALVAPAFFPALASADVLASYGFGTSSLSLAPSSHSELVEASSIWSGGNINLAASAATFGESGAQALGISRSTAALPTTPEDALTNSRWIAFQLTPDEGYSLTLDSVSFYANIASTTGAANTVTLQVRVGDVSNPYVTIGSTTITTVGGVTPGALSTISFSALEDVTETVAFRLLFSNPSAAGNWTDYTRLDDLRAYGTVAAIPEPASAALAAGLGLLAVSGARRRRRA